MGVSESSCPKKGAYVGCMTDPSGPPPPKVQRSAVVRAWRWYEEKKAKTGRFRFWLYFKSWKWILFVLVDFLLSATHIGWVDTWEILVGRESPRHAAWPWVAWPLSIFGWLLIPAFIGGVAGYVVTGQIERRRSDSADEAAAALAEMVRRKGSKHGGKP